MGHIVFITGTDTGAGKTVVTALLVAFLRRRGERVAALKPICSGGRDDAAMLRAAAGNCLTLDEVNPWHFKMPVAPLLAAKIERKSVSLPTVLSHIQAVRRGFDVTLVEGAGGLLSPLGSGFNSRDLIHRLAATPILAAPNRLGVVNAILLSLEALPRSRREQAHVCLVDTPGDDPVKAANVRLLRELAVPRVHCLPWLGVNFGMATVPKSAKVRRAVKEMAHAVLMG